MIRYKYIIIFAVWAIQTKLSYQCLQIGCSTLACFNLRTHVRQKIEPSAHFNSVKEDLFSSPSLKSVKLDLKAINKTTFNTVGALTTTIHPIVKGILIDTIIYRDKKLKLHPPPLYREVYKFKRCLYSYLYVMSYYGEDHIYYQIFRKARYYQSEYHLYTEDKLPDGLVQGKSVLSDVFNAVTGKEIRIDVFGDLISQNVTRHGTEDNFCLLSLNNENTKFKSRETLDFGGHFTKELPEGYEYFVMFKNQDDIFLIISNQGVIERCSYHKENHSFVEHSKISGLEPIVTMDFDDLSKDTILEPVSVDLTKTTFPSYLICNYHDNELTIIPKPNKVITKVILYGHAIDLDPTFPSNYVKVKRFNEVDIVFISGISKGKPLSRYFVVNTTQDTTHPFYNIHELDTKFIPKELDYTKIGTPVLIEILNTHQGISQIGNAMLTSGQVSDAINFYTCLGKVDEFKLNNFKIETPQTSLANFFMFFKGQQSYLISATLDEKYSLNVNFFRHMTNKASSSFRLTSPDETKNLIQELPFQLLSDNNDEFEKPLFIDVEHVKASPGIRINHLPDESVLYTVDPSLFDDYKKSYISSVKIGPNHYRLKPGWSQVGVFTINNSETLVIIDESGDSNFISRTVYSIAHITESSLLSKNVKVDWENPVLINKLTMPLDKYNGNYQFNHLLNFVITDSRGLPGVVTKLDFDNNNIFYLPSLGSNINFGDVTYDRMVDKWDESYIFSVVMYKKVNKNTCALNLYRLTENNVKLISYKFVDDQDYKFLGETIYEPNLDDELLEPIIVDLDLENIDENIFSISKSDKFKTIIPKVIEEDVYKGGKYKIGSVRISDHLNDTPYNRYTEKKVELAKDKISISSLVDNVWLSEVYESDNGKFKLKSRDVWEDLLTLENIQPRRGMQYVTLEMNGDTSMNFLKLSESFYYCGEKITVNNGYVYAFLINNGDSNTTLWMYNPKTNIKGKSLQCTTIPFTNPKFNTKWVDSSHILNTEMAKQIQNSKVAFSKIATLNLDLDFLPIGVIKAQSDSLTIYTSPTRSVGTVAFGNVNLTINSIFTRAFVGTCEFGRFILIESYKENDLGITLNAFKENDPGCYTKIGLHELDGQLEHILTPFLSEIGSSASELIIPSH